MEIDEFWGDEYPQIEAEPPAPSGQGVRRWEERHGVRLPETLGRALAFQDGGFVRGTELVIYPLSEIRPLSGEEWDRLFESGNHDIGDRNRLFAFGADDESQATLILDYNAGPEPRLLRLDHDGDDELREVEGAGTFDDLIRSMQDGQGPA